LLLAQKSRFFLITFVVQSIAAGSLHEWLAQWEQLPVPLVQASEGGFLQGHLLQWGLLVALLLARQLDMPKETLLQQRPQMQ
jgi:hypothetical protein